MDEMKLKAKLLKDLINQIDLAPKTKKAMEGMEEKPMGGEVMEEETEEVSEKPLGEESDEEMDEESSKKLLSKILGNLK